MSAAKVAVGVFGLGIVGVLAWVIVIEPRQQRAAARAEVDGWGERWEEVRRCIAGDQPLSSDATENLALQALTDFDARKRVDRCREKIAQLHTPHGESSGNRAVEDGWRHISTEVAKLNASLSDYAADQPSRSYVIVRGAIATGILSVDGAYDRVRQAAGLPPHAWPKSSAAPLPDLPEGTVVRVGGNQELAPREVIVRGDTVVVRGDTGGGAEIAVVRGPSSIEEVPLAENMLRADDAGAAWAVSWSGDPDVTVSAATLNSAGDPDEKLAPVTVARVRVAPDASAAWVEPIAAVGQGAERAVAYTTPTGEDDEALRLARSHDGGKHWTQETLAPIARHLEWHEDAGHRRFDLVWSDADEAQPHDHWFPLAPETLASPVAPVDLGASEDRMFPPCVAAHTVWFAWPDHVVRAPANGGPADVRLRRPPAGEQSACTDDEILATWEDEAEANFTVVRCDTKTCGVEGRMPDEQASQLVVGLTAKHGPIALMRGGIDYLILWSKNQDGVLAPHPLFKVHVDDVRGVVEWNGTLYAVTAGVDRVRLVPLPDSR
jgi:hypothetical protein